MTRGRILYIVQHRLNRSPGQRYRCEQYLKYLEEAGFEYTYSPIIVTAQEDEAFYKGGLLSKFLMFLKAFYRRWKDVVRAKDYDIIFIYREAFMTGTTMFERMLKKSGAKLVFDFDDAIWLPSTSEGNKALAFLKKPDKINDILPLAHLVLAGNTYLANYASANNAHIKIMPSTIDMSYYVKPDLPHNANEVIIGWSGSKTTIEHFETLTPVLKRIKKKYGQKVRFKVLGEPGYYNNELEIKGIGWTPENEVPEIASFDIGIMPLPDNEWTQGKCGMKGLQYMALGVATIMAAVGANKEIIQDGQNGLLATNDDEWFEKLSLLIEQPELRQKLGNRGENTIRKAYSCQALASTYVQYFKGLLN
jgi:glycosyltransferase involved in cell wall biosynthesis